MILGTDKLLELIKRQNLIEGLDDKEINIEGCGIDLRIGEIYEIKKGKGFIYKNTRKTPEYKLVAKFRKGKSKKIKLNPGKFYIAKTIEKINTPKNLQFYQFFT
jgi:deoxycytidine triphosphate deaminase